MKGKINSDKKNKIRNNKFIFINTQYQAFFLPCMKRDTLKTLKSEVKGENKIYLKKVIEK